MHDCDSPRRAARHWTFGEMSIGAFETLQTTSLYISVISKTLDTIQQRAHTYPQHLDRVLVEN